jgi:hypothetical protein
MCWGHGKTAFYNHLSSYDSATANASLSALADTGANWVQIETTYYMDDCNSTRLGPKSYTPSDAAILSAISRADKLGMKTLLNAHIEVACKYTKSCKTSCSGRNDIDFGSDVAKWDKWFHSYTAFIVHYAKLCESSKGCETLAIHVELQTIGLASLSHADLTSRWELVIAAVRAVFSGKLTASCSGSHDMGDALNISYWDKLDYIGIDTFPNVEGNPVTAAAIQKSFDKVLADLEPLVTRTGRKVLFTQVGYPSCQNCAVKSATFKYKTVDEACQANSYEGILQSLMAPSAQNIVAGLYFWNWLPCTKPSKECEVGPTDNGESPQGKKAEAVLKKFYRSTADIRNDFVIQI